MTRDQAFRKISAHKIEANRRKDQGSLAFSRLQTAFPEGS